MRKSLFLVVILLLTSLFIKGNTSTDFLTFYVLEEDSPIETYALLFDQFPVVIDNQTLCSAIEMKESLLTLGWQEENISLFLGDDNITEVIIRAQLDYLEENVDNNDLVFVFLTAHGHTYCRDILDFNSWFQKEFDEIGTQNKIFLMEACFSGEFVELFYGPCFAMSSVGADSYAIGYTGENGTWVISEPPFVGGISAHFWAKTINDTRADTSGDGVVSLVEMTEYSLPQIRKCYNETFENYPDTALLIQATAGHTENYPIPTVINNLYYDISLNATDFILNNNKYKWEDDIIAPEIECLDTIYFFENNNTVTAPFLITDRSDFNYYCYVDGIATKQGKIEGPYAELQLNLKVNVKPDETHNVSVVAVDEWGNDNIDFTLIMFEGEETKASFDFWGIVSILFVVALVSVKRKISRKK